MLRILLISVALALIPPALLMPGFISENLGGDFSYFELVDGVEMERTNLFGVFWLFISMFLPVFIVVFMLASVVRARRRN